MRNLELKYERTRGTVTDVEARRSSSHTSNGHSVSRTYYYFVISYTYEGQEYKFTDNVGQKYDVSDKIGYTTEVYVNPKNPAQAERVSSSGFVSIICACFFAFFCVTYAAGMNILLSNTAKGTSFRKRLLCAWGVELLLAMAFLLMFWLGLPRSGFAEVFTRIQGAVGLAVISQIVLIVTVIDGLLTLVNRRYRN